MPRSKTGKTRPPVNAEKLKEAVAAITCEGEGKLSFREAARVYNIRSTTLFRHVRAHKASGLESFKYKSNLAVNKIFTEEEENDLALYLRRVARMNYGLTKKGVRDLAFKFGLANKKKLPSSWLKNEIAGEQWMRNFMKRFGNQLSIRKPEATSLARSSAFNKTNFDKFMTNMEDVHRRFGPIPPERIWNLDETGCTTVQRPAKIVAPKGVKQLGSTTSAERGQLVTVICAVSATGNHIPPMIIFPRVNYKEYMIHGAPPGTLGSANPSGWSTDTQFIKFMGHFIKHVKPSEDEPVLLLFDNHETHCGIEAVELASQNGVKIVTFPPHTSGRLQPLDLTVFGPFKTYYNQALDSWHINNPGKTFNIYNVAEAVGLAFPKAFTPNNICNGFKKPGIYPFNKAAFCDDDFTSAYVTDRPNPEVASVEVPLCPEYSTNYTPGTSESTSSTSTNDTSLVLCPVDQNVKVAPSGSSTLKKFSPEEVRPYPKAPPRKQTRRKLASTKILTDTPEKEELRNQKMRKLKNKQSTNKQNTTARRLFKNDN